MAETLARRLVMLQGCCRLLGNSRGLGYEKCGGDCSLGDCSRDRQAHRRPLATIRASQRLPHEKANVGWGDRFLHCMLAASMAGREPVPRQRGCLCFYVGLAAQLPQPLWPARPSQPSPWQPLHTSPLSLPPIDCPCREHDGAAHAGKLDA